MLKKLASPQCWWGLYAQGSQTILAIPRSAEENMTETAQRLEAKRTWVTCPLYDCCCFVMNSLNMNCCEPN